MSKYYSNRKTLVFNHLFENIIFFVSIVSFIIIIPRGLNLALVIFLFYLLKTLITIASDKNASCILELTNEYLYINDRFSAPKVGKILISNIKEIEKRGALYYITTINNKIHCLNITTLTIDDKKDVHEKLSQTFDIWEGIF